MCLAASFLDKGSGESSLRQDDFGLYWCCSVILWYRRVSSPKKSGKRLTPPVKGSNQGFKESFDSA